MQMMARGVLRAASALVLMLAVGVVPMAVAGPAPQSLVSPRPTSWVLDQAGLLSVESEQNIDAMIDHARRSQPVELAVVTVTDAGTDDTRRFAFELFNHWGIGDAQRQDGVLVFLAHRQRAAEIVFGRGIDTAQGSAISQRVMDRALIPRLREGDFEGGLQAAVDALLHELQGVTPTALEAPSAAQLAAAGSGQLAVETEDAVAGSAGAQTASPGDSTPVRPRHDGVANRRVSSGQEANGVSSLNRPAGWFGGGALGLLGLFVLRGWWRLRGRRCPRCHASMQRLSEALDDAHLQPAQRLEEQLGSVDYDVWACTACSFVDTRRYGAWFTRYARCSACESVTLEREQTVLRAATYDHGGRVRVDERCRHCDHRHSVERSTPRKTRPSSGGGGSGGSRSGSSSRGRSGGFSGGRSSGGGASGRW
ncbi:MAG: TPM domain-containing protein [Xanthomonadales bacterium]|nr:TPM domain-containing protein [Xanthomonadales bacterium]